MFHVEHSGGRAFHVKQAGVRSRASGKSARALVLSCGLPEENRQAVGRTIAIANQKGGVGKTTTAINLAAALAAAARRLLAVDSDPQGNLTSGLGLKSREPRPSLYDVLVDQRPLEEILLKTELEHLTLAPADRNLTGAEVESWP